MTDTRDASDLFRGGPPEARSIYELRGAAKHYGSSSRLVKAVDEVDLEIREGSFTAVVGPSGSGKTTLLQLIGALDRPSGGEVLFEGQDLSGMSDGRLAEMRRETIGFVFQQFNLIPTLTASQNVEAALAPNGVAHEDAKGRAADLLGSVGLGERGDHLPSELSGGEQQRVAIARALSNEPRVLLADEPTGNLDTRRGDEIMALLHELNRDGLTIILITHDLAIAERASDVVRMKDGRLAGHDESGARP